jgi:hypothetical protein
MHNLYLKTKWAWIRFIFFFLLRVGDSKRRLKLFSISFSWIYVIITWKWKSKVVIIHDIQLSGIVPFFELTFFTYTVRRADVIYTMMISTTTKRTWNTNIKTGKCWNKLELNYGKLNYGFFCLFVCLFLALGGEKPGLQSCWAKTLPQSYICSLRPYTDKRVKGTELSTCWTENLKNVLDICIHPRYR